jgi:hypothetical protein
MPILKHSMGYKGYDGRHKASPTKCQPHSLTIYHIITDKAAATESHQNIKCKGNNTLQRLRDGKPVTGLASPAKGCGLRLPRISGNARLI